MALAAALCDFRGEQNRLELQRTTGKDMKNIFYLAKKAFYRARGHYPAVLQGIPFRMDPYHLDFWQLAESGRWEPETFAIFDRYLNQDSVYCDMGAWIGPTVLYAARKCKLAYAFEPDPVAYRFLRWNIELNKQTNISSFCVALARENSIRKMATFGKKLGNTVASLLSTNADSESVDVLTLTWDAFVEMARPGRIDFMKIDIEGGEFDLIPSMKNYLSQHKPVIYLSTHAPYLEAGKRKEQMERLTDVLRMYRQCLNEQLQPVPLSDLVSAAAQDHFRSYVFSD